MAEEGQVPKSCTEVRVAIFQNNINQVKKNNCDAVKLLLKVYFYSNKYVLLMVLFCRGNVSLLAHYSSVYVSIFEFQFLLQLRKNPT